MYNYYFSFPLVGESDFQSRNKFAEFAGMPLMMTAPLFLNVTIASGGAIIYLQLMPKHAVVITTP